MLSSVWLKFTFHISAQSGFYFDYFYKKFAEIFVSLCYMYMAQFFGEKFMIEIWTKKFFFQSIQYFNNFLNVTKLNYFWFFFHMVMMSLYLVCFCLFVALFM